MSNYRCPFCGRHQVVTKIQSDEFLYPFELAATKYGTVGVHGRAVVCANESCREVELELSFDTIIKNQFTGRYQIEDNVERWQLRPSSLAKPQPEHIPVAISQDYYEACAILNLSPKASATLSRRCIQGMIRDFCKIVKDTLYLEIKELRKQIEAGTAAPGVSADSIEAIDAVRSIGNIGAHMEKDINVIVDVDPDEARALIELIELLFEDWYIARESRSERLKKVLEIAEAKKQAKIATAATPVSQANEADGGSL